MLDAKVILAELRLPPPKIYICYNGVKVITNPAWSFIPKHIRNKIAKYWFFEYILMPPSFKTECDVNSFKIQLEKLGYKFEEVSQDFYTRVNAIYNKLKNKVVSLFPLVSLDRKEPAIQTVDDLLQPQKILEHIKFYWSIERILVEWTNSSSVIDFSNIQFNKLTTTSSTTGSDYLYRFLIKKACVDYNIEVDDKLLFDITIGIKISNLEYKLPLLANGKLNEFVELTSPDFKITVYKNQTFEIRRS